MEQWNEQTTNMKWKKIIDLLTYKFKKGIHNVLEFWKENIKNWFRIQIVYLIEDIKNKNFSRESENYNKAWENLTLLYGKNLIIILLVCWPLVIVPLPWTAELGIYLYYKLIKLLPEDAQKRLRLEFQIREDLPPALVHANIKWRIYRTLKRKPKKKE